MKPEDFIGPKVYYDDHGQMIFSDRGDDGVQMIADIRGWGAIQNLPAFKGDQDAAGKFQDEMGRWIADAINEKLRGSEIEALKEEYLKYLDDEINAYTGGEEMKSLGECVGDERIVRALNEVKDKIK